MLQPPLAVSAAAQATDTGRMTGMGMDRIVRTFLLADVLEFQPNGSDRPIGFEGLAWIGGDYRRVFLRAQGDIPTAGRGGEVQADVLFGRLITPFWSVVAGARLDSRTEGLHRVTGGAGAAAGGDRVTRGMLAVGFLGIAPFWLEVEPTLYVSQDGDVSADLETSFDLLLTQRLIIQPRLELNAAVQKVPEFGVGAGLNDVEVGARLRYEIRRKFAPYVGVSWLRRTSGTASMARAAGESVSDAVVVAGVRMWR
jgi:copper resistance protein B